MNGFHRLLRDLNFFGVPFSREKGKKEETARSRDIDYEHMSAEKRLQELGIVLPEGPAPGGNYLSAKTVGNLLYLAGVISTKRGRGDHRHRRRRSKHCRGLRRGPRLCLDPARRAEAHAGFAGQGSRNCQRERLRERRCRFSRFARVINGASDLLVAVFGDAGRHVRAAIGVSALPRNALVELQMIVAI
jgi:enamine deaminase RidA (YjgF/YER057c/UK114 family)